LEIDLKKVDRKINPSELKELIINNLEIRTILNQEKTETEKEKNVENYLMYIIGIIIIFFGFRRLFKRKKYK